MVYKELLSAVAIVLTFVAFFPYIRAIINGAIKPHVFSWIIWGMNYIRSISCAARRQWWCRCLANRCFRRYYNIYCAIGLFEESWYCNHQNRLVVFCCGSIFFAVLVFYIWSIMGCCYSHNSRCSRVWAYSQESMFFSAFRTNAVFCSLCGSQSHRYYGAWELLGYNSIVYCRPLADLAPIGYATWPAHHPDDQAHWKLYPPSQPVTSTTSPIKYRLAILLDSMVLEDSSLQSTPPSVTSAVR